jgi:hypothetical protein
MINSVTVISLNKDFLIEDRFEKKYLSNYVIEPRLTDTTEPKLTHE